MSGELSLKEYYRSYWDNKRLSPLNPESEGSSTRIGLGLFSLSADSSSKVYARMQARKKYQSSKGDFLVPGFRHARAMCNALYGYAATSDLLRLGEARRMLVSFGFYTASDPLLTSKHIFRKYLNVKDKNGHTPLRIAIDRKQPHAVEKLLSMGADPSRVYSGFTVSEYIFLRGRLLLFKGILFRRLVEQLSESRVRYKEMKISQYAIANNLLPELQYKLRSKWINWTDHLGRYPLHVAIDNNDTRSFLRLCELGADESSQYLGFNAMQYIIEKERWHFLNNALPCLSLPKGQFGDFVEIPADHPVARIIQKDHLSTIKLLRTFHRVVNLNLMHYRSIVNLAIQFKAVKILGELKMVWPQYRQEIDFFLRGGELARPTGPKPKSARGAIRPPPRISAAIFKRACHSEGPSPVVPDGSPERST